LRAPSELLTRCRQRRGLAHYSATGPGVSLAEPRFTQGFMASRALQAARILPW
jgi:hypothetical protein